MHNSFSLNLKRDFLPTSYPELKFNSFIFNGGELNIKIDLQNKHVEKVIITSQIMNSNDLIEILLAKDALHNLGINNISLFIPYLPYARQDRICNIGEAFSLKTFCGLINSCNFTKVFVLDAHSDVGPALLNNCVNISNNEYVIQTCDFINEIDTSEILLISPDAGANKKANKLFLDSNRFTNLIKCDKIRDLKTGNLTGFEVFSDDLQGKSCLIVDDICDGGRTFIGIVEELKKKNAGNVYLFITHGIFSAGLEELNIHFKKIYTTNSFKSNSIKKAVTFNIYLNEF